MAIETATAIWAKRLVGHLVLFRVTRSSLSLFFVQQLRRTDATTGSFLGLKSRGGVREIRGV